MRRIIGIVVVAVILGAGFFVVRPFLQGYLGARGEKVPPAPVQVDNPPVVTTPAPEAQGGPKSGEQGTKKAVKQPTGATGNQAPKGTTGQTEAPSQTKAASTGESKIDIYYRGKLAQIGNYYQQKLNALVSQAYQNYLAVKEGKSHTSLAALAGQYISEGDNLEEQSDKQFLAVWEQYREALAKAGLPTTYLEQARQEYIKAKAAERAKIMAAAKKYME